MAIENDRNRVYCWQCRVKWDYAKDRNHCPNCGQELSEQPWHLHQMPGQVPTGGRWGNDVVKSTDGIPEDIKAALSATQVPRDPNLVPFNIKQKHVMFSVASHIGDTVYEIDLWNPTTGESGSIVIQDYGTIFRIGSFTPGVVESLEGDTPKTWPNECANIADPNICFEFVRMYLVKALKEGWLIVNNDLDR